MTLPTRLEPEALEEIVAAARWYERRRSGLGEAFSDAAFEAVGSLRSFPNAGKPVWGVAGRLVARQVRLQRYPYLIVYVVAQDAVRVVAIAHERQQPAYWAARLEP